jgi:hypothetical protein
MIDAQFRFNQCNSFREEYISVFPPYGTNWFFLLPGERYRLSRASGLVLSISYILFAVFSTNLLFKKFLHLISIKYDCYVLDQTHVDDVYTK